MSEKNIWLYGLNPVLEAIRAGSGIKTVYISSGRRREVEHLLNEASQKNIPVKIIYDARFFDERFPKGHQHIAAELASRTPSIGIDELLQIPEEKNEVPFFVILDLVEDPRNLGAVVRTAEAAGVHGVVVQERRAAGLTPEAVKSSAGASQYLPVASVVNIKRAVEEMKEQGIRIVGAEADAPISLWDADLDGPIALILGSEGKGMRRTVKERCDLIVGIPMTGHVNSLNTSVSAGILIYEILRKRRIK